LLALIILKTIIYLQKEWEWIHLKTKFDFNGIEKHIKTCIEKNKSTMLAKNTKIRI
jgi:hypothetical protein